MAQATVRETNPLLALVAFIALAVPMFASSVSARGFDPPKSHLLIAAAVVAWGLAVWRGTIHRRSTATIRSGPLLVMAAAGIWLSICTVLSDDPWTALLGGSIRRQGLTTELSELAVAAAAFVLGRAGELTAVHIQRWACWGGAAVATAAACQSHRLGFLDPTPWGAEVFNRVAGPIGHPGQLAMWIALTLPPTVAFAWGFVRLRRWGGLLGAAMSILAQLITLLFTRGRGGMLALAVTASLAILFATPRSHWGILFRRASIALWGIALVLVGLILIPQGPFRFLDDDKSAVGVFLERIRRAGDPSADTMRTRILAGESVAQILAEKPMAWAIGFGPDAYWPELARTDSDERKAIEKHADEPDRPHVFLAEKVLTAGLPWAFAWSALTMAALFAGLSASGHVARAAAATAVACGTALTAYLLAQMGAASRGLAMPIATLAFLVPAFALGIRNVFGRGGAGEREAVPGAKLLALTVAGHFVAGAVSVSSTSERAFAWVLVGWLLGACAAGAATSSDSVHSEQDRRGPAAGFELLTLGVAVICIQSCYVHNWLSWSSVERPVRAAWIVPAVVAVVASLTGARARGRSAAALVGFGLVAAGLLFAAVRNGSPDNPDLQWEPAILLIFSAAWMLWSLVGFVVSALSEATERAGDKSASVSTVRSSRWRGALVLALGGVLAWIGFRELHGEGYYWLAIHTSRAAQAQLEEASGSGNRAQLEHASRLDARARALLEEGRGIAAPLSFLGAPSSIDRVLRKHRP
ncbi:MAG: hypothetical protein JNJ88_09375 [Planctomycetes bacterium]|nr:hypothetical protein [Planctomycetota bacterium]